MYIQVSRCYYHPDTPAVAACSSCGVGICKGCAVKDDQGRIICYKCGNKLLKQEHREYQEMLKESGGRFRKGTEFIIPGIIGVLIVVAFGVSIYYDPSSYFSSTGPTFIDFVTILVLGYMLFSIPFGYIALSDFFAPKYNKIDDIVFKTTIKVSISLFIGWIFFTFFWIRFIVRKITSKHF